MVDLHKRLVKVVHEHLVFYVHESNLESFSRILDEGGLFPSLRVMWFADFVYNRNTHVLIKNRYGDLEYLLDILFGVENGQASCG
jgi:hypothetical protein